MLIVYPGGLVGRSLDRCGSTPGALLPPASLLRWALSGLSSSGRAIHPARAWGAEAGPKRRRCPTCSVPGKPPPSSWRRPFLPLAFPDHGGCWVPSCSGPGRRPPRAASNRRVGGMGLAVAYGSMTFQRLRESVYLTVRTTGDGLLGFSSAPTCFSSVFSYLGGEHLIAEFVGGLNLDAAAVLASGEADHLPKPRCPLEWSEIISSSCRLLAATAAIRHRSAVLRHPGCP